MAQVAAARRQRPANFDFYVILSLFRIAAIVQGIAKRAQEGTANDPKAAEMGKVAAAARIRIPWMIHCVRRGSSVSR